MATNYKNIQNIDWQLKFNTFGEVVEGIYDIEQCIKIILSTPKGSDPHRPLFGSDIYKFIDNPVNIGVSGIISEIIDAVNNWEPRCEITKIVPIFENEHVTLQITWKVKGYENIQKFEVII